MRDKLTARDFKPHQGESFVISAEGLEPLNAGLAAIDLLGPAPGEDDDRRHSFSLVFETTQEIYLPQQIYTVEHPVMGKLKLFLVPIGPDRFEAVFT